MAYFGFSSSGGLSGSLTTTVLNRLIHEEEHADIPFTAPSFTNRTYQPGDSIIHRLPAVVKIGFVMSITLLTVFFENLYFYGVLLVVVTLFISLSSLRYALVFSVLKKLWGIILGALLLPLFFNHGTQYLLHTPIHQEAVLCSLVLSLRIILLALLTNLLARTTSIGSFTNGIRVYLKPCDLIGINSRAIAENISSALSALPQVWVNMRSLLSFLPAEKPRNVATIIDTVILLFIHIFAATNHSSPGN